MLKKSLKSAIGVGIGIAIGGCVLPRIFLPNLYNGTWPPIWQQAGFHLLVGYAVSFLIFLIINWVKSKR